MVELNAEEEKVLRELIDARNGGHDVEDYLNIRLYGDLSAVVGYDSLHAEIREYRDGFHEFSQACKSLADKGLLIASHPQADICRFKDLTGDGRCYFDMKEARRKERRAEIWSERRFTLFMCLLTFLLGLLSSWLISSQVVERSLQSLLGS